MTGPVIEAVKYAAVSASLGIEGSYDPTCDCQVNGVVTVPYAAVLKSTGQQVEGYLRKAEDLVVSDISRKLSTYDAILAERDALLLEKQSAGNRRTSFADRKSVV